MFTKSDFVVGSACPLRLHKEHSGSIQLSLFDQHAINEGLAVERTYQQRLAAVHVRNAAPTTRERADLTAHLISTRAQRDIYEATFIFDGCVAAVDHLTIGPDGVTIREVKASTASANEKSPPGQYIGDLAYQTWVVEACGHLVEHAILVRLDADYRHGVSHPGDLFTERNITDFVRRVVPGVPAQVRRLQDVLRGPEPKVDLGPQCQGCPVKPQCWPSDHDHVRYLYRGGHPSRQRYYAEQGLTSITELSRANAGRFKLSPIQERQIAAAQQRCPQVDVAGLASALSPLESGRVGYLDFETASWALPPFYATAPYEAVPIQFSYHERSVGGPLIHNEYLAKPLTDPREHFARALISATASADHLVVYYAQFEGGVIERLATALPHLTDQLEDLRQKLFDLLPVVRQHVYHPEFRGSYSIKKVLPALCPEFGYAGLAIADGMTASIMARRALFDRTCPPVERTRIRSDLLTYCHLDTLAMVEIENALRTLCASGRSTIVTVAS